MGHDHFSGHHHEYQPSPEPAPPSQTVPPADSPRVLGYGPVPGQPASNPYYPHPHAHGYHDPSTGQQAPMDAPLNPYGQPPQNPYAQGGQAQPYGYASNPYGSPAPQPV